MYGLTCHNTHVNTTGYAKEFAVLEHAFMDSAVWQDQLAMPMVSYRSTTLSRRTLREAAESVHLRVCQLALAVVFVVLDLTLRRLPIYDEKVVFQVSDSTQPVSPCIEVPSEFETKTSLGSILGGEVPV